MSFLQKKLRCPNRITDCTPVLKTKKAVFPLSGPGFSRKNLHEERKIENKTSWTQSCFWKEFPAKFDWELKKVPLLDDVSLPKISTE